MIALPMPVALDDLPEDLHPTMDLETEVIREELARLAADWWLGSRAMPPELEGLRAHTLEEFVEAVLAAA